MARIDTDKLTPQQRQELIKQLEADQRRFKDEELLDIKAEFEDMARQRGLTLGQIFLAGAKRATGPRKRKSQQSTSNQED